VKRVARAEQLVGGIADRQLEIQTAPVLIDAFGDGMLGPVVR
jgi:hypothetical protein